MAFLKKLRIELPYNPAIPLLGVYLNNSKTFVPKDICAPMFIAVLFTVAQTWRQPKCPSKEDCVKKMWYIYTREYYSAIRKDEILPFTTTRMHLESIMLSKRSESEKAKNHVISLMWDIKLKLTDTDRQQHGGYRREGRGGSEG